MVKICFIISVKLKGGKAYISRHRGRLNSDVWFEEDTGAPVEGGMYRAGLLLLVKRTHAACAVLRLSLLRNCAQRYLRVVPTWLLTALLVAAAAATQFPLLVAAAGFWLVRLQLEPRRGRLGCGWWEAVGVAERLHLAWWTNHHQQHRQEDKAVEETQEDQGEKNQEEVSEKENNNKKNLHRHPALNKPDNEVKL